MGFTAKRHPELQAFFDSFSLPNTDHEYKFWMWDGPVDAIDYDTTMYYGRKCSKCGKKDPTPGEAKFDHTICPG